MSFIRLFTNYAHLKMLWKFTLISFSNIYVIVKKGNYFIFDRDNYPLFNERRFLQKPYLYGKFKLK